MSQQNVSDSKTAVMQRGSVVFAAGMARAALSIVVELAILRMFSK
jgi:hypothetical protein